ncbi:MAG: hypothetical protein M1825_006309 [Sarcosagium campestre]|nr:MAG: hypothetical protein M1825_006309 [Sarcosagium campestre]
MSLDKIPGNDELYIGSIFSVRRKDALKKANITNVLTVLRKSADETSIGSLKHLFIEVDDTENDDILVHFPRTNKFIQDGLDSGGGVLVHW